MNLSLFIRPEAQQDLLSARDWYEEQREGLGEEFNDTVSSMFEIISKTPKLFGVVWQEVRSCRLRRFPYLVHDRVLPDRVEVLAVLHASRDRSAWRSRV